MYKIEYQAFISTIGISLPVLIACWNTCSSHLILKVTASKTILLFNFDFVNFFQRCYQLVRLLQWWWESISAIRRKLQTSSCGETTGSPDVCHAPGTPQHALCQATGTLQVRAPEERWPFLSSCVLSALTPRSSLCRSSPQWESWWCLSSWRRMNLRRNKVRTGTRMATKYKTQHDLCHSCFYIVVIFQLN